MRRVQYCICPTCEAVPPPAVERMNKQQTPNLKKSKVFCPRKPVIPQKNHSKVVTLQRNSQKRCLPFPRIEI